jgi:hypothetical protein
MASAANHALGAGAVRVASTRGLKRCASSACRSLASVRSYASRNTAPVLLVGVASPQTHAQCVHRAGRKSCREALSNRTPAPLEALHVASVVHVGIVQIKRALGSGITRQSTPTPKGVCSLRSHLFLGAGYFYVSLH